MTAAKTRKRSEPAPDDDIPRLVRRAHALAQDLIVDGLNDADGSLYGRLEEHVGMRPPIKVSEKEFLKVINMGIGAFAIGIAVGLLLRPEAFVAGKGGAK